MALHTFLGVIGYGAIALFVFGVVLLAVHLAGYKQRKRWFQQAEQRFEQQRARVGQCIRTGKKII